MLPTNTLPKPNTFKRRSLVSPMVGIRSWLKHDDLTRHFHPHRPHTWTLTSQQDPGQSPRTNGMRLRQRIHTVNHFWSDRSEMNWSNSVTIQQQLLKLFKSELNSQIKLLTEDQGTEAKDKNFESLILATHCTWAKKNPRKSSWDRASTGRPFICTGLRAWTQIVLATTEMGNILKILSAFLIKSEKSLLVMSLLMHDMEGLWQSRRIKCLWDGWTTSALLFTASSQSTHCTKRRGKKPSQNCTDLCQSTQLGHCRPLLDSKCFGPVAMCLTPGAAEWAGKGTRWVSAAGTGTQHELLPTWAPSQRNCALSLH